MWDLTRPITDGMATFPGDPAVAVSAARTVETDGYAVSALELGSHTGTHVDAPAHVFADGRTLDTYDVDRFIFDAAVVDCRDLSARDPIGRERVPPTDAGDCAVFHTGWDAHYGTERAVDHPYLAPSAARACAERGLAVATDALNPDPSPSDNHEPTEPEGVPAHEAVLGAELPIVENLTNLERVPDRFELRVAPLPLARDGAPARAVGVAHD